MSAEISEMTELAYEGSTGPLTTTPVIGSPDGEPAPAILPDTDRVADGEIRVTILGSGDPFTNKAQGSASVLMEVGNPERDFFFFDLGSGSLANFNGLHLPVTATTRSMPAAETTRSMAVRETTISTVTISAARATTRSMARTETTSFRAETAMT